MVRASFIGLRYLRGLRGFNFCDKDRCNHKHAEPQFDKDLDWLASINCLADIKGLEHHSGRLSPWVDPLLCLQRSFSFANSQQQMLPDLFDRVCVSEVRTLIEMLKLCAKLFESLHGPSFLWRTRVSHFPKKQEV